SSTRYAYSKGYGRAASQTYHGVRGKAYRETVTTAYDEKTHVASHGDARKGNGHSEKGYSQAPPLPKLLYLEVDKCVCAEVESKECCAYVEHICGWYDHIRLDCYTAKDLCMEVTEDTGYWKFKAHESAVAKVKALFEGELDICGEWARSFHRSPISLLGRIPSHPLVPVSRDWPIFRGFMEQTHRHPLKFKWKRLPALMDDPAHPALPEPRARRATKATPALQDTAASRGPRDHADRTVFPASLERGAKRERLDVMARQGAPGDPGPVGAPGLIGDAGRPGARGIPGEDGRDGWHGVDGTPGRDGRDGTAGRDGADGQPGRPGTPGQPGTPGTPGQPGAPGGYADHHGAKHGTDDQYYEVPGDHAGHAAAQGEQGENDQYYVVPGDHAGGTVITGEEGRDETNFDDGGR
ncbi:unnamed protein product, partial [Ostreobium quekettii]